MKIQNYTIVLRGSKGEVMKGVFDVNNKCISGSAETPHILRAALDCQQDGGELSEEDVKDIVDGVTHQISDDAKKEADAKKEGDAKKEADKASSSGDTGTGE